MSAIKPVIILIEDNPSIRRVLRTELSSRAFEVHEADTGQSGMSTVENRKADLVILDLGLSDIGGLVVLKRLRAWTTMPVIVVSARIAEEDKITALDAGAERHDHRSCDASYPRSRRLRLASLRHLGSKRLPELAAEYPARSHSLLALS
jgi:CheY-like chemotaxis protein